MAEEEKQKEEQEEESKEATEEDIPDKVVEIDSPETVEENAILKKKVKEYEEADKKKLAEKLAELSGRKVEDRNWSRPQS